jgi:hypothetical protein
MTEEASAPELAPLHAWFTAYCSSFQSGDADVQRHYALKELHTRNVCRAAGLIAQGGTARRAMLAQTAALCHDLGRFPQFRDFGTFDDSKSLNHAHLSAQILEKHDLLAFLPESEVKSVLAAVRLHNVYRIPLGLPPESEDLLKLLRDADKVDIWRVFIEYYQAPEAERASGTALGFADLPFCSPEVLAAVAAGKLVQLSTVQTVNDFKLLQVSWLYDINFRNTCTLIRERGLLERLAATLPREKAVLDVVSGVLNYLDQRLQGA